MRTPAINAVSVADNRCVNITNLPLMTKRRLWQWLQENRPDLVEFVRDPMVLSMQGAPFSAQVQLFKKDLEGFDFNA